MEARAGENGALRRAALAAHLLLLRLDGLGRSVEVGHGLVVLNHFLVQDGLALVAVWQDATRGGRMSAWAEGAALAARRTAAGI